MTTQESHIDLLLVMNLLGLNAFSNIQVASNSELDPLGSETIKPCIEYLLHNHIFCSSHEKGCRCRKVYFHINGYNGAILNTLGLKKISGQTTKKSLRKKSKYHNKLDIDIPNHYKNCIEIKERF